MSRNRGFHGDVNSLFDEVNFDCERGREAGQGRRGLEPPRAIAEERLRRLEAGVAGWTASLSLVQQPAGCWTHQLQSRETQEGSLVFRSVLSALGHCCSLD